MINTDQLGSYLIKLNVSDGITTKSQTMSILTVIDFAKKDLIKIDLNSKGINCIMDRIFLDSYEEINTGNPGLGNSQPVANVGDGRLGVQGQQMMLDGSASFDIDLDTLTYQWSLLSAPATSTANINNSSNEIASITPDVIGDYVVQLVVADGSCNSNPDSALMTISVNQVPTINSIAQTQAIEAHNYNYQVDASDPENHNLSYALTVAPAGMTIASNGLITWIALTANTYAVTITVTDEHGAATSQTYDILVTQNHAPKIQSWPISSGEKDFSYSYQLTVTDAENDSINYALVNPPVGMTIDATGLIAWLPTTIGTYAITIHVDDGFAATDIQTYALEIIALPPNPNDIAPPLSRTEYTPFPETISFIYENNPPIQVGMPVGTIEDYRVAVITGKVLGCRQQPHTRHKSHYQ